MSTPHLNRSSGNMLAYALEYALVDVFAERALEGNQLAIFTDARGLSTEQMQALARETNLAETTFIVPEEDESQGVRVRIFTVQEELPFAGHPTLGTASWLFWNHLTLRDAAAITLRLNAGPITVQFQVPVAGEVGVFGTMKQSDPVFGMVHSREEVARAMSVALEDIEPQLPIQTVSTGLPFCIVPMTSLAAIERLCIPQAAAQAYLAGTDAKFFYCITPADPARGSDFHSRMQFYNGEDPATGSASGCAIAYLVHYKVVRSSQQTVFEQGIEMRRPSRVYVSATHRGEDVTDVFVSGRTISVASGRFFQR
jgi:trans-2,3-dihydro-3-hydroxyanthranilate isomerase